MNDIKTLRVRKARKPITKSLEVKILYFNTDCKPIEERPYSRKFKKRPVTKNDFKTHKINRNNVISQEHTQDPHILKGCLSITPEVSESEHQKTKTNSDSFLTHFVDVSTDVFTKLVVNIIAVYYNILPTEQQQIRIPRSLPRMQAQLRMYHRQMIASQESCCCPCKSDLLFKIIKSIYDCYKINKKNTKDNLKCVLRDHLTEQERLDKASETIEGVNKDKKSNILIPLSGKATVQKGNVSKRLVNLDIALPKGMTISENVLIEKLRNQLGLPELKTAEKEEKLRKAANIDIPQPKEEINTNEKDNFVQQWIDSGIKLPLRKSVIDNIKNCSTQLDLQKRYEAQPADSLTPKQLDKTLLRNSKTHLEESRILKNKRGFPVSPGFPAGKLAKSGETFLKSLDDNTLELKESILRGLARSGMALPKGRTMSERKLIYKISKELGLPLKPKTAGVKINSTRAQTAGLITSLEGKSNIQKDKLFQKFGEKGMSSPEGRTRTVKALIKKTQGEVALEPRTAIFTSVKRSQSKAADFITSFDSKNRKQREIMRGPSSLPLSEKNTSEKKKKEKKKYRQTSANQKSRNVIGSQKDTKTQTTASFTPLEARGHTKRIHRDLEKLGISMPENHDVLIKPASLNSKPLGLGDKIIEQKGNILQVLSLNKLLLFEGWTEREKQLLGNIRNKITLPPQSTNGTVKSQLITPLRRKSPPSKIKLVPVLEDLPNGTIPSGKAHINKIQTDVKVVPLMSGSQRDKLANAKIARLKTGAQSPEHKERILRALALSGMPLSEGRSASKRKLIRKIKKNLGLPPGPKTDAEKNIYAKAQAAGYITPLEGKSTEQKAKILKKIARLGISLPEGRTVSEKALIKKLKTMLG